MAHPGGIMRKSGEVSIIPRRKLGLGTPTGGDGAMRTSENAQTTNFAIPEFSEGQIAVAGLSAPGPIGNPRLRQHREGLEHEQFTDLNGKRLVGIKASNNAAGHLPAGPCRRASP